MSTKIMSEISDDVKENSSDDEAPEDISLVAAKQSALERQKIEKETIKRAKELKKNKRRKHEEKFAQQKKIKLLNNFEKLPDNILEAISEKEQSSVVETEKTTYHVTTGLSEDQEINDNNEDDEEINDEDDDDSNDGDEKDYSDIDEEKDFEDQPKMATITARVLKAREKELEQGARNARDFLRDQLYGDRVKRVDSSSIRNRHGNIRAKPHSKF
eukprot:gene11048-12213_t